MKQMSLAIDRKNSPATNDPQNNPEQHSVLRNLMTDAIVAVFCAIRRERPKQETLHAQVQQGGVDERP